jgi:hypothetical protein
VSRTVIVVSACVVIELEVIFVVLQDSSSTRATLTSAPALPRQVQVVIVFVGGLGVGHGLLGLELVRRLERAMQGAEMGASPFLRGYSL